MKSENARADSFAARPAGSTTLMSADIFESKARMDGVNAPRAISSDAPLYHYTDAAGLAGMLQNKNIWLTSRLHVNDPSEVT
jgi:hypothetical protein